MDLYIANTTKQHHIFFYWMPEGEASHVATIAGQRIETPVQPKLRRREIKAGRQVCIQNLTAGQIGAIVAQHAIYGIQNVKEMSRVHGYVGYSYNVDAPVPVDAMLSVFEMNDKAKDERARERIVLEAADVSNVIAKDLADKTGKPIEEVRPNVEVSHLEENTDNSKPLNIGVEARRDRKPFRARS